MKSAVTYPPTITRREALSQWFRPLTTSYRSDESWMLRNALRDLKGCKIVLVESGVGPEIWRSAAEIKDVRDTRE